MEQDITLGPVVLSVPGIVVINCSGASTVSIDLNSISTPSGFSYDIEGTINGTDWFNAAALDPGTLGTFTHTTLTALTGQWLVPCAGLSKVRFNLGAIAAGDALISMTASSGVAPVLIAGGSISIVPSFVKLMPAATGGLNATSFIVANDVAVHVIKASPGQLYGITTFNNDTGIAYLKLYDAITATAGVGVPDDRFGINIGFHQIEWANGVSFGTGISAIITTGIGNADATAPAASTFMVTFYWK